MPKFYSLIPAARYCGLAPQEFLQKVRGGFIEPPNGVFRWHRDALDGWCGDYGVRATPQPSAGNDGDVLSFAEVATMCGLTNAEIRARAADGKFPAARNGRFRQCEVEAWLLGLWH